MTCQNCVRHVKEALGSLPGVRSVNVDLTSGSVVLDADRDLPKSEIATALDEAGYSLS
jgi:copper chaperone CopZ